MKQLIADLEKIRSRPRPAATRSKRCAAAQLTNFIRIKAREAACRQAA